MKRSGFEVCSEKVPSFLGAMRRAFAPETPHERTDPWIGPDSGPSSDISALASVYSRKPSIRTEGGRVSRRKIRQKISPQHAVIFFEIQKNEEIRAKTADRSEVYLISTANEERKA